MTTSELPPETRAQASRRPGASSSAAITAGLLGLAVISVLAVYSGIGDALGRPLWLDEVLTRLVAHAPVGIVPAMRSGIDFQPPLNYLFVRIADALAGGGGAFSARLPSVVAAALSVLLFGAMLRQRLSLMASLAGVCALAAHPLFVAQVVEARPYALWICCTLLTIAGLQAGPRWRPWCVAAAAVALCSAHYFGILTLATTGAVVVVHGRFTQREPTTSTMRSLAPLGAGLATVLALMPLVKAQLAGPSGVGVTYPATAGSAAVYQLYILGWRPAAFLLGAGMLLFVARRMPSLGGAWRLPGRPTRDLALLALLATACVPAIIGVISLVYRPVLEPRYSVPALLAMATLCALTVEMLPRAVRWVPLLLLLRAGLFSYQSKAADGRFQSVLANAESRIVHQLAGRGISTVSQSTFNSYRASLGSHGTANVAWLDVPDSVLQRVRSTGPVWGRRDFMFAERNLGRTVKREVDFPTVVSIDEARATPAVALLRDESLAVTDSIWFPGRTPCRLSPRLVVYSQPARAVACDALRESSRGSP